MSNDIYLELARYLQNKLPYDNKTLPQLTYVYPNLKFNFECIEAAENLAQIAIDVLPVLLVFKILQNL